MTAEIKNWIMLLTPLVVISALLVVCVRYDARVNFNAMQREISQQDALENEWARLQLERNTWSTTSRIERVARESLNLVLPKADQIIYIKLQ
jgi:cell division protein FtsL